MVAGSSGGTNLTAPLKGRKKKKKQYESVPYFQHEGIIKSEKETELPPHPIHRNEEA